MSEIISDRKKQAKAASHEWYTPKDILQSFEWHGRVWCNPPYGKHITDWVRKCAEHNDCVLLIFARTDTAWFKKYIWDKAAAVYFFPHRITFIDGSGERIGTAPAPSMLIAYGERNVFALSKFQVIRGGVFIRL